MFFLMTLALRLGKTLNELSSSLSASELKLWLAYNRMSPIGDTRGDIQTASIVSAVINSQGGKISMDDALLKWGEPEKEEEGGVTPLERFLEGLAI